MIRVVRLVEHRRRLATTKSSAAGSWSERLGLTIVVEDEAGRRGLGEAAPLPAYSQDGVPAARAELSKLLGQPLEGLAPNDDAAGALRAASRGLRSPAARMALESALLDLSARQTEKPAWALLRGPDSAPPDALELSLWVASDIDEALREAHGALERGVRSFKVKLYTLESSDPGVALLEALRTAFGPDVELRADANRSGHLPLDATVAARLEQVGLRYLEEPASELPQAGIGIPLGLDETLAESRPDFGRAGLAGFVAAILKPTTLGGIGRALELASEAKRAGLVAVASHALEGPVAYAATAAFALALGPGRPADGLAPHVGLGTVRPPCLTRDVRPSAALDGARLRPDARRRSRRRDHPRRPEVMTTLGSTLSVFDAARAAPSELAVLGEGTELSYRDLAERVRVRLGELSAVLDTGGERPVAFVAEPTLASVTTLFALFSAGTPALPLHARLTPSERKTLVERAGALEAPPSGEGARSTREAASAGDDAGSARDESPSAGAGTPGLDPERIAALVATSGTTGVPKLTRLSHRALVAAARAHAAAVGVEPDDRTLLALPLAHVGGLMIVVRALVTRRALVLFEPGGSLLARAGELSRRVADARVTQLSVVPALLERLLSPEVAFTPPPTLRAVLVGGAACPKNLATLAHERRVPLLPTYGLTEACSQVATRRYAERFDPQEGNAVGPPLPGVELRIAEVDAASGTGALEVRGPTLFSGYAGEPESDPRAEWYRTGDLGYLDERGALVVTGRASDSHRHGGRECRSARGRGRPSRRAGRARRVRHGRA